MTYIPFKDSYDSKPEQKNGVIKWFRKSRFYCFFRMGLNFYQLGNCAKKGLFNRERQIFYSEKNFRTLEDCGAQIHLRGLNYLDSGSGPFVLVGNHVSSIETAILNAIISPRLVFTYVIKSSLFRTPFFGPAMTAINAIGVDRVNARDDFKVIIEEGKKRLNSGCSVLIFPEATRQKDFHPDRFNSIGTKLAKNAKVKIIPFALKTDFIGPGLLFNRFGPLRPENHIYIEFGEPIELKSGGKEEHQQIVSFISSKIAMWKNDAKTE